jgi:hypothetical protein
MFMRHLKKPERPARAERTPMPARVGPKRRGEVLNDWADGADMLEGLGGIDPDYDRAEDAVPPELRAQWRPSRFDGE